MIKRQIIHKSGSSKKSNIVSVIIVIIFTVLNVFFATCSKQELPDHYLTKIIEEIGIPTAAFVPSIEYYFSNDGSDSNDGLSPNSPLKDPTPYFNISGASLLFKSGDVFYLNEISITNGHIMISSYGGSEKAVLSGLKTSNNTYTNVAGDVYSVGIDDTEIGALIENGKYNWSRVSRQDYLSKSGDYYFDAGTRTLYKKSNSNIEGTSVQYSLGQNGIKLVGASNVVIQNVEICNYGRHGVNIGSSCSNITVENCYVHDIGGAELFTNVKYGNAIQVWSDNCHDISITNNTVTNIYDTGITAQNSKTSGAVGNTTNIRITQNKVSNCYWGMEFYNNQPSYSAEVYIDSNTVTDIRDITLGYRWDKSGIIGEKGGANALRFVGVNQNDRYYVTNNIFADSEDAALFIVHDISGGIAQFSNNKFVAQTPLLLADPSYYDGQTDILYSSSYYEYLASGNDSNEIDDESVPKSDIPQSFNKYIWICVGAIFLSIIAIIIVMLRRSTSIKSNDHKQNKID